jgi:hypothetical protein
MHRNRSVGRCIVCDPRTGRTENKPAIAFYERLGGKYLRDQTIEIGGVPLKELEYGWEDLSHVGWA